MGHKVDMAETIAFSDDLKTTAADISSGIAQVEETINQIRSMESFTGQTAVTTRNYLNDFHLTVLDSFDTLFQYLDKNMKKHVDSFHSKVDSSKKAIVQIEYVTEIQDELDINYKKLKSTNRSIAKTIDDVSDIVAVTKPDFNAIINDYRDASKTIDELEKNLESFTGKGKGHDNTTKEIIQSIEVILSKAKAVDPEKRMTDFKYGTANKEAIETKGLVDYLDNAETVLLGAKESIGEYKAYNQSGRYNNPKVTPHPSSGTFADKAKYVAKETGKEIADDAKRVGTVAKGFGKALGPAAAGLSYYSNYHDAVAQGLEGRDAHIRAAEDTAVETVVSGAVQGFFTAAGTAFIPIPGVGTAAGVAAGVIVNGLLNVKFGKTKKSVMDRAKSGFRRLRGWFS